MHPEISRYAPCLLALSVNRMPGPGCCTDTLAQMKGVKVDPACLPCSCYFSQRYLALQPNRRKWSISDCIQARADYG